MRLKSFLLCLIVIALFTGCTKAELSLNIDEITWLKKNNMEIVFVGQINYPPFEFISDERGDYTGMAIELIRWMGTELGFTPVFKPMTFASAQQTVLNGKADALTGIFESPQRKLLFDFTDEVFSVPASIFIHSDRTDIITVQDLAHKKISVQRGDYAIEYLKQQNIPVEWIYTDDFKTAIEYVAQGKADANIGDEQIVLYHIYKNNLQQVIKKIGEPLYVGKDCMAVAKGNAIVLSILQKGLQRAYKSGVLEQIYQKWLGLSYSVKVKQEWSTTITVIIAILLGLIIVSSFWIIQLRATVQKKTREIQKVNNSLQSLNQQLIQANEQLVIDLKEHRRLEEERKNVELKIEKIQKFESLALMASSVAHDFNNYLTGILGNIELALSEISADTHAYKALQESRNIALQSRELIHSMLDFAGSTSLRLETLTIQSLINDIKPLIETSTKHQHIVEYIFDEKPITIKGDKSQLKQSIFNIVLNAIEAVPSTNGKITITCTRKEISLDYLSRYFHAGIELYSGEYALIIVEDNGPGIPKSMLSKIFDPFFSTKKSGRGIGLSSSMGIIKAHGGCIIVDSEPRRGSQFSVALPFSNT